MGALYRATRLACAAFFCFSTLSVADELVKGSIEKTVDGDTLWVQANQWGANGPRERLKIRMIGIDAPETHLPTSEGIVGQGKFGEAASAAMAKLAPIGTKVTVEDKGLDKYERTLGRVLVNKTDINLRMIEIGWAIPYIICEGPSCDEQYFEDESVQSYFDACNDARKRYVGIFNKANPLKEMPFEFRLRMSKRRPDKYVGDWETGELYRPADYAEVDLCSRVFFKRIIDAKRAGFTPVFRPSENEQ